MHQPLSPIRIYGKFNEILPIIQTYPAFENDQGYLYCFNCIDNHFKVGRASDIEKRMLSHNENSRSYAGVSLDNTAIIGPFINCKKAEAEAIKTLIRNNFVRFNGKEWFLGDIKDGLNAIKEIQSDINKFGIVSFFYERLIDVWRLPRLYGFNKKIIEVRVLDLRDIFIYHYGIPKELVTTSLFRHQLWAVLKGYPWIKMENDIISIEKQELDKIHLDLE